MAHFAKIDSNGVVLEVLSVDNSIVSGVLDASNESFGAAFLNNLYGTENNWRQTSYSGRFRRNYAGVGYKYDSTLDAFYPLSPHPSWVLGVNCQWQPPTPYPTDGQYYYWNESTLSWVLLGA